MEKLLIWLGAIETLNKYNEKNCLLLIDNC